MPLNSYFSGYNLSYSLSANPPAFLSIVPSLNLATGSSSSLPSFFINKYLIGRNIDGSWGSSIVALDSQNAFLYVGTIDPTINVPSFTKGVGLINSTSSWNNLTCFDLAQLTYDLVAVDCRNVSGATYSDVIVLANIHTIAALVYYNYQLVVPSSNTNRNLRVYNSSKGYTYLLRAQFAVNNVRENNSYVEVFIWNAASSSLNQLAPIDRDSLNVMSFSLTDMQVYGQNLFLVNGNTAVSRVQFVVPDVLTVNNYAVTETMTNVYVYYSQNAGLQVLFGSDKNLYIIDWNDPANPYLLEKYQAYNNHIDKIAFCEDVVIFQGHLVPMDSTSQSYLINIYKRGQYGIDQTFISLDYSKMPNSLFDYDPINDLLMIFDATNNYNLYSIRQPMVVLNTNNVNPGFNTTESFPISCTMFYNSTYNVTIQSSLNISLLPTNTSIYPNFLNTPATNYSVAYPGDLEIQLSDYFIGPDLSYSFVFGVGVEQPKKVKTADPNNHGFLKLSNSSSNSTPNVTPNVTPNATPNATPNFLIRKVNDLNLSLSSLVGLQPENISFVHFDTHPVTGALLWFLQKNDNLTLFTLRCAANETYVGLPNCSAPRIINFTANINELHVVANASLTWFGVRLVGNDSNIQFWDFESLSNAFNVTLVATETLYSFSVIDFNIYLVLKELKLVRIVPLPSTSYGSTAAIFNIDSTYLNNHGVPYGLISAVIYSPAYENMIVVQTDISVNVLDITFLSSGSVRFLKSIQSNATKQLTGNNAKVFINEYVLIIAGDTPSIIEEWSINDLGNIYLKRTYPLYGYTLNFTNNNSIIGSNVSPLLYVLANISDQSVVLAYDSSKPSPSVLFAVIPLGSNVTNVVIQTQGLTNDKLGVFYNNTFKQLEIFNNPVASLASYFNGSTQTDESALLYLNISVTNSFTKGTLNASFIITNLNTRVNFTFQNADNIRTFQTVNQTSNVKSMTVSAKDLINGTIVDYSVNCVYFSNNKTCKENITNFTFFEPLYYEKSLLSVGDFNDIRVGANRTYIQRKNRLFVMENQDFNLTYIIDFPVSSGITCYKVAVHVTDYYTASICQSDSTGKYTLYLTSFASSQPFSAGIFNLDISSVGQIELLGKYVFLLDNNGPSGTSSLHVYSLDLLANTSDEVFQLVTTIDDEDLETTGLTITGFDVQESGAPQHVRIFILDSNYGLRVEHLDLSSDKHSHSAIDLHSYIEKYGGSSNEIFANLKVESIIYGPVNSSLVSYTVLVSSKTFHTFEYNITYNYSNDAVAANVTVLRYFFRYSVYEASNGLFLQTSANSPGYFVIPYILPVNTLQNTTGWAQQLLVAYDLKDYNVKGNSMFTTFSLNSSVASSIVAIRNYTNATNNAITHKVIMTNPINGKLDQLALSRNLTFVYYDQGYDNVELQASNYYVSNKLNVSLIPNNGGGSSDDSNYYWIIGLVVGLIVVAILIVIAVKKFGKKKGEPLLGDQK